MAPQKKPGCICCVKGCKNTSLNSPGTQFYVFSSVLYKKPQRDKWVRAVNRKGWISLAAKETHPYLQSTFYWKYEVGSSGTQVDFLENADCSLVFECSHYNNEGTLDVKVQACIPLTPHTAVKIADIKKHLKHTQNKGCGSNHVLYKDVAVGPDSLDDKKSLTCTSGFHGLSSITDDQELLDLAGVTFKTYNLLLKVLKTDPSNTSKAENRRKETLEDRLLIFLFKMKLGLTFSALGVLFQVHRSTVSRNFFLTLHYLAQACQNFVPWPDKVVVQATMPAAFKETYKDCRVIIDCTEIRVEQPTSVEQRVHLYSHNKKGFTIQFLVACTPSGFLDFLQKK